jgi:hypothetical protein
VLEILSLVESQLRQSTSTMYSNSSAPRVHDSSRTSSYPKKPSSSDIPSQLFTIRSRTYRGPSATASSRNLVVTWCSHEMGNEHSRTV